MRKKITLLFVITLLSAQTAPVFAQYYGPNGLCNPDQMRMCGEQIQKGASYLYHQISRFVTRVRNYKPSDELVDNMLRTEAYSPLPSAQFHRATWEGRRAKQKQELDQKRNKKTVVNTNSYEMNPPASSTQKPANNQPATKRTSTRKK